MTENPVPERRVRFVRVVAVTWVSLISALTILNFVVLSHLSADKLAANGYRGELSALQERVSAVEQALEAVKEAPKPVSQTSLIAVQQALEDRLTHAEQLAEGAAPKSDLTPLRDRLNATEGRLETLKQARATALARTRTSGSAQPKTSELPFTVLGTELRGGQRFLAIAPARTHALGQVHVLRVGDVEDNWRLEMLDGKAAVFRSEGRLQRVDIP